MSGRNHHYIQRLLLKGFAFPDDAPSTTWVYQKGRKPKQKGLKGYAVGLDFYGGPGDGDLDSQITELETHRYNAFIQEGRKGPDREVDASSAASFVMHAFSRANNIRRTMTANVEQVVDKIGKAIGNGTPLIEKIAAGLQANPAIQRCMGVNLSAERARELAKQFIDQNSLAVRALVAAHREAVPNAVASAHNDVVSKLNASSQSVRAEMLSHMIWFRTTSKDAEFIQGDSVLCSEISGGRFKPFDEPGDKVVAVWLPLSSNLILVGAAEARAPVLDVERINRGLASCSFDAFCAKRGPVEYSHLEPLIRTSTFEVGANEWVLTR